MDENTAPVPARASRSLVVQSQISTWNPRSAIRWTRSMIGSSRKTISAHTASSTDHDPTGVPSCCCGSMSCDPFAAAAADDPLTQRLAFDYYQEHLGD